MDWLQMVVTACVLIISAVLAFIAARSKGKSDLQQLDITNKAGIDRLMKQHEINIANLRETHQLELKKLDIEHKQKILEMEKESELRVKEQEQNLSNSAISSVIGKFMRDISSNPSEAKKTIEQWQKLGDSLEQDKK